MAKEREYFGAEPFGAYPCRFRVNRDDSSHVDKRWVISRLLIIGGNNGLFGAEEIYFSVESDDVPHS